MSADFLAAGEVSLFQAGEYEPRHVLPANQIVRVPAGTWYWIASAPGYVSVEAGAISVPASPVSDREPRRVIAPVVPACEIRLGEPSDWPGVLRVDLVSLEHGATYPSRPGRLVRVPAGRWLGYAITARGLLGITRPRSCVASQQLLLRTISPPRSDREEWMVHVTFEPGGSIDRQRFRAQLLAADRSGSPPILPAASSWVAGRASFFFLDIPVVTARRLQLAHPSLRTREARHEVAGGQARDLGQIALSPRRSLDLTLDYRPKRDHRQQRLVLRRCSREAAGSAEATLGSCEGSQSERWDYALKPGVSSYRFPGLDDGQYRFDAEIDDEVVWGLGRQIAPFLSPEDDEEPAPLSVALRESEIHGRLLEDGEPIQGEVRLLPLDEKLGSPRHFPTGEDGFFHLYYFGFEVVEHWFPAEVVPRIPRGTSYLDHNWRLSACAADGACRTFGVQSRWVGEGRWDIELGSGGRAEFKVLDAETRKPIEGALVLAARNPALYFLAGKLLELPSQTQEPDTLLSDSLGQATVITGDRTEITYAVTHFPGYGVVRGRTAALPGETVRIEVLLPPEDGQDDGVLLLLDNGEALRRAFLLVIDDRGARDLRCSRAASRAGRASFPDRCIAGKKAVLIHSAAALQLLDGDRLLSAQELRVAAAPTPPYRLRLRTAERQPLYDAPVALRFPEVTLEITDFYVAASATSSAPLFDRTDARGQVALRGVDPWIWGPVEAFVPVTGQEVRIDLGDFRPGDLVELVLPDP